MKLWTFHTPDFSLTSGSIDLDRSFDVSYVTGLREAYEELARHLGLERYEILWCHNREDFNRAGYRDRVEYKLDVPDDQFLCIVDSYIWNKIIGLDAYPTPLYFKWREEAAPNAIGDYIEKKLAEYHSQPPPPGGWWSRLVIEDLDAEGACVLLRHPIPEAWIVEGLEKK